VTWCIIWLEVAIRRWVHTVVIKRWTWTATILRKAVMFKLCSTGTKAVYNVTIKYLKHLYVKC